MRTLYLLNLDGNRYGVWKDEISSITDVQTVHRIPLSPDCIAGVSVIDGRSTALADLMACIGLRDRPVSGPVKVFFVAGKKNDSGFVISGGIEELDVPPDTVYPLPAYLKTPENDTCVLHGRRPIPVINLTALYDRIHERSNATNAPALSVPPTRPAVPAEIKEIHLFRTGGEVFAFPGAQMAGRPEPLLPGSLAGITLAPRYVKGLASHRESVLPVISLAERMGLPARSTEELMAMTELSGVRFGFLIDEYLGSVHEGEAKVRSLPPAASTGWATAAVIYRGAVIPLLDPAVLLAETDREDAVKKLPGQYSPDRRFQEAFERTTMDVMEFSLLGVRHALPKTEVEDLLPFKPYRRVPDSLPIVIGITEHDGEVLPVLDLALVFGRRSLETPEWKLILVKNGDFRAFVITERLYGERVLPRDIQRKVPIVLPHALVYGCYPEGVAVRLILNVEALTVHFDKSVVRDLLPALTSEMAAAPSELVPSLLPEEHLKEEAAAASRPEAPGEEDRQAGPESWQEQAEDAMLMRTEAEQLARQEAEAKARAEAEENLGRAREEELRRQAAEDQARREAEELSRLAEEETRRAADEQARQESEEERKRLETAERIRKEAEELARQRAETEAQRAAEEQKKIEEEALARHEAEERARREAEEEARKEAENLSRRAEEEAARRAGEERTRLAAEEQARKAAEEQRRGEEEARALQAAQERARREAEEQTRRDAEEKARRKAEELRRQEEESARRAAEEQARREVEERARREAEEAARKEAAASQRQAEELARKAAEERMKIEEEARARQEAQERARSEAEAEAKRVEEERKRAAAAAIREAEKISREREREHVPTSGRTLTDRVPSPPPGAAASSEKQQIGQDRQKLKKYIAIAAGLVLVSLLYFGSQRRLGEDPSGDKVVQQAPTQSQKSAQQGDAARDSVQPDTGKERKAPEPKAGRLERAEVGERGSLVLTVPQDRPLETDIYIVKKGDTLWAICKRFTGNPFNYPRVARDNSIANPDRIFPGQKIHLKK